MDSCHLLTDYTHLYIEKILPDFINILIFLEAGERVVGLYSLLISPK